MLHRALFFALVTGLLALPGCIIQDGTGLDASVITLSLVRVDGEPLPAEILHTEVEQVEVTEGEFKFNDGGTATYSFSYVRTTTGNRSTTTVTVTDSGTFRTGVSENSLTAITLISDQDGSHRSGETQSNYIGFNEEGVLFAFSKSLPHHD